MITVPEHPLTLSVVSRPAVKWIMYRMEGSTKEQTLPPFWWDRRTIFPCSTNIIIREPLPILPVLRKCGSWA